MRILFIGDVIGKPGRKILSQCLNELKVEERIDFTIANAENLAHGFGVTRTVFQELMETGVDFCTSGNHIWDRKEIYSFIDDEPALIRPANYPPGSPGRGFAVISPESLPEIGIVNLAGRVFMEPLDNPFLVITPILEEISKRTKIIFIDFHAEATSEKIAFGHFMDGKASAVIGTHTHVQTGDESILPGGTAYITDVGMTGGHDSVIGVTKEPIIERFLLLQPRRFEPSIKDLRISYVVVEIDIVSSKAVSISRGQTKNSS